MMEVGKDKVQVRTAKRRVVGVVGVVGVVVVWGGSGSRETISGKGQEGARA